MRSSARCSAVPAVQRCRSKRWGASRTRNPSDSRKAVPRAIRCGASAGPRHDGATAPIVDPGRRAFGRTTLGPPPRRAWRRAGPWGRPSRPGPPASGRGPRGGSRGSTLRRPGSTATEARPPPATGSSRPRPPPGSGRRPGGARVRRRTGRGSGPCSCRRADGARSPGPRRSRGSRSRARRPAPRAPGRPASGGGAAGRPPAGPTARRAAATGPRRRPGPRPGPGSPPARASPCPPAISAPRYPSPDDRRTRPTSW